MAANNVANINENLKRLCISYLDEADAFILKNSDIMLRSIVSLTATKDKYISGLESDWKQLRITHQIPPATYLHFADIKTLLNSDRYHNSAYASVFSNEDGTIDYGKLNAFYNDILDIIKRNEFVIQTTGIAYRTSYKTLFDKIPTNSMMYQLFRDHLDRMAYYLIDISMTEYRNEIQSLLAAGQNKAAKNKKINYYFAKLRYDGDYLLNERNDFRNAFSHCISDGTRHFSDEIIKEVFDTLSFISKKEVALCTNCDIPPSCSYEFVSHAGDELLDFIAIFVARDMWKNHYKELCLRSGESEDRATNRIDQLMSLAVPGYDPIVPMPVIEQKLYTNQYIPKYGLYIDYVI